MLSPSGRFAAMLAAKKVFEETASARSFSQLSRQVQYYMVYRK